MTPDELRTAEAAAITHEELDSLVPDDDTGFEEPECWGLNSYEHYKNECKHFYDEYHMEAAREW